MASSSVFLYQIVTNDSEIGSLIYKKIKSIPEDELNYFNIQLISKNEISGEFINVQNVEEFYYNAENRSFETRTVFKANVLYFDIYENILEIWGNKAHANKLVFRLSDILDNVSINLIEVSLKHVIKKLQFRQATISKVNFEDFLFTEDIVGNFSVDLSSYGDAFSILDKYQNKISRMTVILALNGNSIKLSITSKGSIVIYQKREQLDEDTIAAIHDILLK